MANTFTSIHYHVIFSTKNREHLIHSRVRTFEEEYRTFLDRHEIDYNEEYLFG